VREGVDREVFSYRWRGSLGFPAQGEVNGVQSDSQVPGRVLGPERGERGEGLREPSGGWVGVRRGAGHPKGGQVSPVPTVWDDRRETGLAGKYGGGCREEIICCPSLDPVPEAVHASERGGVRSEEVGSIREYGEEEAVGYTVA